MKYGTPTGDLISTMACLRASPFATGLRIVPVRETGGERVPAETVQDDHVMYPPLDFLVGLRRDLVVWEVYIKDLVWAPSLTGGPSGPHVGGEVEVSRQPYAEDDVPGRQPGSTRHQGPVEDIAPLWHRVVNEGLVHRASILGGVVPSEGQDGHRVPLVYKDGGEPVVAQEATLVGRSQPPVMEGIQMGCRDSTKTPDGISRERAVARGAVNG